MMPCQKHLGSWGLTMQRLLSCQFYFIYFNFTSWQSYVEVKIGWAWFCCQAVKPKSVSAGLTKVLKEQVHSCNVAMINAPIGKPILV